MTGNTPGAGITVTTKFFVLAFLLYFFKPVIHVDGSPGVKNTWGTTFFPLPPGQHTVRCYVPYLFFPTMGDNSVTVDVPPECVIDVTWNAPWLVFLLGKMTVGTLRPFAPTDVAVAQPTGTPANWYPDPKGRHHMRYWNGTAWTDNVSDNGVTATDAI